jgi:hypothetical protein
VAPDATPSIKKMDYLVFLQQSLPAEQTPSLQQSAQLPALHFSHLAQSP